MSQSNYNVHHRNDEKHCSNRISDENDLITSHGTYLHLQSLIDDIPFQFNPKYRSVIVPNIDIPEYENTENIQRILSRKIDFQLESRVFSEALEDLRRKKKIESDNLYKQSNRISTKFNSDDQRLNSLPCSTNVTSVNGILSSNVNNSCSFQTQSLVSSVRISTVRDIKWPSNDSKECNLPLSLNAIKQSTCPSNSSHTKVHNDDLTAMFDGTLTSNDPFHDVELRALNNVSELEDLYSTMELTKDVQN